MMSVEVRVQSVVPPMFPCYDEGMSGMPRTNQRRSVVYMATNIATGDRYIGFTSRPFNRRKSDHLKGSINGWSAGLFAEAICQYGKDAFVWELLGTFSTATAALSEEQRLIRALRPEYNRTRGGGAYKPLVHSDQVVRKLQGLARNNLENWQAKYAHLGPAARARPVVCLDDEIVYPSAAAAGAAYGISASTISEVCKGTVNRRTAGGRVFRYHGTNHGGVAEALRIHGSPRKHGANPYKGVYPHVSEGKDTGRWRARIVVSGADGSFNHSLGIFDTPEAARDAYERASEDVRGIFRP